MNDKIDTFDRLVLTLESSQRQEMLKQLAAVTEQQEEEARSMAPTRSADTTDGVSPEAKLLAEPFLIRLLYKIYALFTSGSPVRLYSEHLVAKLGKKLQVAYGSYIDTSQVLYTYGLYQELVKLRKTQVFFSTLLTNYEDDKGGFYIILASLLMARTSESILNITDPFSLAFKNDQQKDVRLQLLRELDAVLMAIPDDERGHMYQAVQAIEWVKNFCSVPLERMVARFSQGAVEKPVCALDAIDEDLKQLVNSLYGAKRIPVLLLEALYLFAMQDKLMEDRFDLEGECAGFVKTAGGHLSGIGQIKATLPLADFVRYAEHDVTWQPLPTEGGEDWFMLFKNAWKSRLEVRAAAWSRMNRRTTLEKDICSFLDVTTVPTLQYHPWHGIWMSLTFRRELSMAFLETLFNSLYPLIMMKPLKILLIEGDFYRRENLEEFTDAFSALEHQQQVLQDFEMRLSPKGDIGEGYALVQKEKVATIRNKARVENLLLNVESESGEIIGKVTVALRSMDAILNGVLNVVRGGPYETLVNMAAIQGKQNERFRKELSMVRQMIQSASAILAEAELIEKE